MTRHKYRCRGRNPIFQIFPSFGFTGIAGHRSNCIEAMNLNSPVKMLPQEVKTPPVPDSEMCTESSTMSCAEDKRKAGADALAAPYAKKRATSDCSIQEDKTSPEGSSASTGLSEELDCLESDKESDTLSDVSDDEGIEFDKQNFPLVNISKDKGDLIVYRTAGPGDVTGLKDAVASVYPVSTNTFTKLCDGIEKIQRGFEKRAKDQGKCIEKMHVQVPVDKNGVIMFSVVHKLFK